jgi:ubiquinone/menaquinone biosynthesis C-methylase UbiE
MSLQAQHRMLPEHTHDELAREGFAAAMRKYFTEEIFPGNRTLYREHLLPEFEQQHGRPPATRNEVKELMNGTFYYRAGSLLGRATQELMWDVVGESIERQLDQLKARLPTGKTLGSLRVNPGLDIPSYVKAVDIHVMPGNFHTELGKDDILAGALYDRGVHVFSYGGLGELNQGLGESFGAFIKQRFPEFTPKRILDMGCGVGFSTLPFTDAYPQAEVHGIDIGAPMVRYAHARAEALGKAVHFSQQNATQTDFPDASFDLVYSALLHHEMPARYIEGTIAESYRLLRKGGIMFHDGVRPRTDMDPLSIFLSGWFASNINEPFTNSIYDIDFEALCLTAGFRKEDLFYGEIEPVYLKGQLPPLKFRGAIKR